MMKDIAKQLLKSQLAAAEAMLDSAPANVPPDALKAVQDEVDQIRDKLDELAAEE